MGYASGARKGVAKARRFHYVSDLSSFKKSAMYYNGKPIKGRIFEILDVEENGNSYSVKISRGTLNFLPKEGFITVPKKGERLTVYFHPYPQFVGVYLKGKCVYSEPGFSKRKPGTGTKKKS